MRQATKSERDRLMRVKAQLIGSMKSELVAGEISKPEALALFAQVTGMLIAMQDQRTMTPDDAMTLVSRNIQEGNASFIDQMFSGPGGTA